MSLSSPNANRLVTAEEDGMVSWESIARAAIHYMADDDIGGMISSAELLPEVDEYEYQIRLEDGSLQGSFDDIDEAETNAQTIANQFSENVVVFQTTNSNDPGEELETFYPE